MPTFPGPEWLVAYEQAIKRSFRLKEVASEWVGDITLVVEADPAKYVLSEVWAWFDLNRGDFRGAKLVTPEEGERAKFVIRAPFSVWKDVILGKVDPIRGMTQGKLKLSGDLPEISRHRDAVAELVKIAAGIDTQFADD